MPTPRDPKTATPEITTCRVCRQTFAQVDPDEQEVFEVPDTVCGCTIAVHHSRMAGEGFVLPRGDAATAAVAASRKARWPVRYGIARTMKGQVISGTFVSPVIPAALRIVEEYQRFTAPETQAEFVATFLRRVTDPAQRAAMATTLRIGGDDTLRELMFDHVRAAAGEDP